MAITHNQYNGASHLDAAPRRPRRNRFSVSLIPTRFQHDNARRRRVGDAVNIKSDGLAKYFQRQFLLDRE